VDKILLTPRDDIFVVKGFCSDEYCEAMVARAEAAGFGEIGVRVLVAGNLAKELWPKVEPLVTDLGSELWKPCGLNERFRFYRYVEGQKFDWHFDAIYARNPREASRLTFMLYLSDGFEGGTTDFCLKSGVLRDDDPVVKAVPEKGMALIFTHNVLHRGAPVTAGCKYVLRSDVMYRMVPNE